MKMGKKHRGRLGAIIKVWTESLLSLLLNQGDTQWNQSSVKLLCYSLTDRFSIPKVKVNYSFELIRPYSWRRPNILRTGFDERFIKYT